ncbi:serine/threonine protein kinase [Nostoc minutum NIES-26]|uniref:Serine/threonine protein kinase n=1 Tax=Nostoc minutum NIES-26 TaxID=1844469 RepID=A0A367RQ64_9NOSO|nr:serine/threonine protein kinase [Nostoc minutum NIES-26]
MSNSVVLSILESSQAGEARRNAVALASRLGFNETAKGKVAIVATEIANNLVQHAREGLLLLQTINKQNVLGIEILSLDKGPGIHNIDECLRDGFSTASTPGNGLGAISRLSDVFEIYSRPNEGTAILSQLWAAPLSDSLPEQLELGVVCLPKTGEEVSGDAWASKVNEQYSLILVADGLGHGPLAARASLEAVRIFEESSHRSPKEIVEAAHGALRSTRGAALAIAQINFEQQSIRFTGVGNIGASFLSPVKNYSLVSHNGTVGHEARKIQEFTYQWHPSGILIMHSDGLSTQWRLERYAGLSYKHPSLIAGILYRDFNRDRDDVTVLVAREGR